ncbi:hypothetical protein [Photobacterium damselae]|uniref:hypothetical protein n=1 Tax=Photobacterium damselae TaxID=38293 RepID=UPI004068B2C0
MSLQHPEDILKHALSTFGEATKELAELSLFSFTHNNKMITFCKLKCKYVSDYEMDIMWLKFPISIYPLEIDIKSDNIASELGCKNYICNSKHDLCDMLNKIFLCEAFTKEVTSLVNIAAMNKSRS